MSSDEDGTSGKSKSKLGLLDPINASITKSGLKLKKREPDQPEKKDFLYFPSVTYTRRKPPSTDVHLYAYGTHDIIKLLVTGGVPAWVFQPQYWNKLEEKAHDEHDRFYKYRSPTRRMCELWEIQKRPNILRYDIEKSIVEARQKQKKILRKVSKKADDVRKRTEKVLQKNAETRQKRVDRYLEKLEKRAKDKIPKNEQAKIERKAEKQYKKRKVRIEDEEEEFQSYRIRLPSLT